MNLPPLPPLPTGEQEEVERAWFRTVYTAEHLRTYAEQYGRLCAEAGRQSLALDALNMAGERKQQDRAELDRLQARVAELEHEQGAKP
jgi:hypothetical protein